GPPAFRSAARAGGARADELVWERDLDVAIAKAQREKKRLFLDFTGFQCTNCRKMEQSMFPRPEVQAELRRFVLVQLHMDAQSPAEMVARSKRYQELQLRMFGVNSMPYYAIVDSDGTTVVATFPDGY